MILRYSLAAKPIYFAQTIDPRIVEPYAEEFDQIIRDTYLRIIDAQDLTEAQLMQLSLPLRDGGCGLRSHTLGELRRLFVSSAMLIAPAVQAAIGQRIGIAEDIDDMAAADLSPFELCLEDSIDNLEHEYEIFRPDFNSANPSTAKSWATSVS